MVQKNQPYDSSLKSLLEGLAAQVIPELLAGIINVSKKRSESLTILDYP
jgi:hypothetical protein